MLSAILMSYNDSYRNVMIQFLLYTHRNKAKNPNNETIRLKLKQDYDA